MKVEVANDPGLAPSLIVPMVLTEEEAHTEDRSGRFRTPNRPARHVCMPAYALFNVQRDRLCDFVPPLMQTVRLDSTHPQLGQHFIVIQYSKAHISHTHRHTDRHTDRQTDRQTDTHTHTHTLLSLIHI